MYHLRNEVPPLVRDEATSQQQSESSLPNLHSATHRFRPRVADTTAIVKSRVGLKKRVDSAEPTKAEKIMK